MKIAILGAGGVGLGMAALLSEKHLDVAIWAPSTEGSQPLLDGKPLVADGAIAGKFAVAATTDIAAAINEAAIIIIAVPGTGHKQVIDQLVAHLRPGQIVAISSHMSLSALYLSREIERRGIEVPISAWATTAVTGRRVAPGHVHVSSRRKRIACASLPSTVQPLTARTLGELFGDVFIAAPDLMTVTVMNTNPTTHLAIVLCNLTRMEYGEDWGTYHGISEAVGRLVEGLDAERIALAERFGSVVHTIREHLHASFGLPLGTVAEMAAEQHARRNGQAAGPKSLDHRYITEDIPFGIVPLVVFGHVAGINMPLHSAGLELISALCGRRFSDANDILASLAIDTMSKDRLLTLCREGFVASGKAVLATPREDGAVSCPELISYADVETAARNIGLSIVRTPFLPSQTLSDLTGAEIWLKFENLQFTASFKERGALNRLMALSPEQAARGVVAVSAGNHAQGVALHARRLGIPATIIMPRSTPRVKIARTESFGARVILAGADFAEALTFLPELIAKDGLTLVHPFSDPHVIAGQGTVGLEMLQDGPQLDLVIAGVGGGGLISGIATAFAHMSPSTTIIGVQSELYPSMAFALDGRTDQRVRGGTSVAEGIAVATADDLTLRHIRQFVSDVMVVPEQTIEDAVALLLQIEKSLCEGAGAAGLAAVLAEPDRFRGKRVGLVLSGGNIDTRVLISVLRRHLARGGQLVRLTISALDNAGGLGAIATLIGAAGGNILDVHHERIFGGATARVTDVAIDVELSDPHDLDALVRNISDAGYPVSLAP